MWTISSIFVIGFGVMHSVSSLSKKVIAHGISVLGTEVNRLGEVKIICCVVDLLVSTGDWFLVICGDHNYFKLGVGFLLCTSRCLLRPRLGFNDARGALFPSSPVVKREWV